MSGDVAEKPLPAGLAALVARAGPGGRRPPLEKWNPPDCGAIDMRIAGDGTWHYLGSPIARLPLVKLFASVLRREGDDYFLVTPVEKVRITVDDAPFLAVEMHLEGTGAAAEITFRSNVGDVVTAGPQHPLRFAEEAATGGLKPYVLVRPGLEALLSRALVHELADHFETAQTNGADRFGIWSGGAFFAVIASDSRHRGGAAS